MQWRYYMRIVWLTIVKPAMAGCGCTPGFLKLFKKCVCVWCMFVCLSTLPTWANHKVVKTRNKGYTKPVLHLSLLLRWVSFSQLKTWHSNCPQTLRPVFLVKFSGVLQLKSTTLGLIGTQEMHISLFEKWVWRVLTQTNFRALLRTLNVWSQNFKNFNYGSKPQRHQIYFMCA